MSPEGWEAQTGSRACGLGHRRVRSQGSGSGRPPCPGHSPPAPPAGTPPPAQKEKRRRQVLTGRPGRRQSPQLRFGKAFPEASFSDSHVSARERTSQPRGDERPLLLGGSRVVTEREEGGGGPRPHPKVKTDSFLETVNACSARHVLSALASVPKPTYAHIVRNYRSFVRSWSDGVSFFCCNFKLAVAILY